MTYNRFCICVFEEKDNIVRDYVIYYLKGLQEVANKITVNRKYLIKISQQKTYILFRFFEKFCFCTIDKKA